MGATWRYKGGLPAEEWTAFGYSPRRRSIAYLIGANLLRGNYLKTAGVSESLVDTEGERVHPGTKNGRRGVNPIDTEGVVAAPARRKGRAAPTLTEAVKGRTRLKKSPGGEAQRVTEPKTVPTGEPRAGEGERGSVTETECAIPGPYCERYREAKAACALAHPDYSAMRCHRHGMLLATKLLLKNLWKIWNPALDRGEWSGVTEDELIVA
jgi:hypothetical protein